MIENKPHQKEEFMKKVQFENLNPEEDEVFILTS
jgi:hypothetical protein